MNNIYLSISLYFKNIKVVEFSSKRFQGNSIQKPFKKIHLKRKIFLISLSDKMKFTEKLFSWGIWFFHYPHQIYSTLKSLKGRIYLHTIKSSLNEKFIYPLLSPFEDHFNYPQTCILLLAKNDDEDFLMNYLLISASLNFNRTSLILSREMEDYTTTSSNFLYIHLCAPYPNWIYRKLPKWRYFKTTIRIF